MKHAIATGLVLLVLAGCATTPRTADSLSSPSASFGKAAEADLYLGIVDGLIRQGRYEAAIAFLDEYKVSQAASPRYQLLRGDASLGAKRYDDAIAAYKVAAGSGFAARAYSGLGRVAAAQGDWSAAAADFTRASVLDPANAAYLNNIGYAKLHLGGNANVTTALTDLKRAHELDPDSGTIRNNLILAANLTGDQAQLSQLLAAISDNGQRARVTAFAKSWSASDAVLEGESP
jgi:tetratricopeptide (TPR) repeat protein